MGKSKTSDIRAAVDEARLQIRAAYAAAGKEQSEEVINEKIIAELDNVVPTYIMRQIAGAWAIPVTHVPDDPVDDD